jgi:hypothetical protein
LVTLKNQATIGALRATAEPPKRDDHCRSGGKFSADFFLPGEKKNIFIVKHDDIRGLLLSQPLPFFSSFTFLIPFFDGMKNAVLAPVWLHARPPHTTLKANSWLQKNFSSFSARDTKK